MSLEFSIGCVRPIGRGQYEYIRGDKKITLQPGESVYFSHLLDFVFPLFQDGRWDLSITIGKPDCARYVGERSPNMRALVAQEGYQVCWDFFDNADSGDQTFRGNPQEILAILEAVQKTITKHNAELPKIYEFWPKGFVWAKDGSITDQTGKLYGSSYALTGFRGTTEMELLMNKVKYRLLGCWDGCIALAPDGTIIDLTGKKELQGQGCRWKNIEVDGPVTVEILEVSFQEAFGPILEQMIIVCRTALNHGWLVETSAC